MAGIPFGFLGQAIDVLKWAGSYLCCFTSNINTLKDEAITLDYQTSVLRERLDADKNDGRVEIYQIVKDWLTESGNITRRKERILDEAAEVGLGSGCFNYAKRVSLSNEAKETAEAMKELVQKCKFVSITRSLPIAAASAVPFGKDIHEFNSRKRFEEDIMTTLDEDKNVDKVGVWGIGGVGKTIMAQKILNRALEEGLFHEVVMVTVRQPVEKLVIQKKIAEILGLKLEDETLKPRADTLRARLRHKKRSLILLDDVWEAVNLEELGIPCDGEWCKIILTSRDKDVLKRMKVENVCELGFLDEDEAWGFFKKMAGTCVDDVALNHIAKDVMRECKGLLVALESVGKAHEDEKRRDVWWDSLQQLRKHNPVDIPKVIKEVYRPLKLSYDRLESKNAKSTILLCCLFAEDAHIPLEHLTYFAMGLHLFDGISELEEVKGRVRRSIDTLRNRCLLLDSSKEDHVRMHDVVRDVSIFIASEERRVNCSDCTWISSHVDGGARPQSCFPKLKLLFMNNKAEQDTEINIVNLIARSSELSVLFIEEHGLLKSLPVPSLKTSLTTLVLRDCESLESIAVVGQLESLEILICHDCNSIKELPEQVKGLKHLKLLQISDCEGLKRVAAGVISSLVALEELKIVGSFDNWKGGEIEEGKEASLREIEYLKKLRRLNIEVSDIALAAQPLRLSPELLVQFQVHFGEDYPFYGDDDLSTKSYQRIMSLNFGDGINWGDFSANIFLTSTECLHAHGTYNQDFNLNLAQSMLRCLSLKKFGDKKNITSAAAFPLLEYLSLKYMPNLEEIWDDDAPIPSTSFNNLKHLRLYGLPVLKRMGKSVLSTVKDLFLQLETIEIKNCEEMEELLVLVPREEEQDQGNHISTVLIFPKLKILSLRWLPKLRSMISSSRGIESIQFPLLAEMVIKDCGNLKWISDDHDYHDDAPIPSNSFRNLKHLKLIGLHGLKRMGKSVLSTAKDLFLQLETIEIRYCEEMEELVLVPREEEQDQGNHISTVIIFPKLKILHLWSLPKLRSMISSSRGIESIQFPLLAEMTIVGCGNLKWISDDHDYHDDAPIPSNSFRNLKHLKLIGLHGLKRMGKSVLSTAKDLFLQLETIEISYCKEMEHLLVLVPREEEQEQGNHISTVLIFPKLKTLTLQKLPKLRSMICSRGIESIQFPLLAEMTIDDCGNLKWISDDHDYYHDDSSHLFCLPKVSFPNLKKLTLVESGCSNYSKRVCLTKEAKKTAEAPLPIAATSSVTFRKVIYEFRSRKWFEEDIMTTLDKDKNVDKVGVWGIGGVGKTIMAQKILNRALEEGLFDEVVMVTVSQPVDKLVIQSNIAENLCLTLKEENLDTRADRLRARLRQKKRTLLLLDDVWEVLNLEKLGIPCDGEWCTIILTSRDKDVLKGMKVENVCELGVLDEDEAWDFFIKMTGTCVYDVVLKSTAYEVMKECKGLLVALESVGKAHEDEKRLDVWRDSLQQLRKHNPVDIPNVIKEVYRPLKVSYDRLESENAKSTILLCCLFAEDAHIPLEHLTYFAMGLHLFDGISELEEVRDRVRRSIDTLRNRCLLLDSFKANHVRMHDVVRDVSIFIASEERRVKCSDCTWISSHVDGGARLVPPQSAFPKLKLLFMNNKAERDKEINIVNLIAGSSELSVLFIEEHGLLKSLPVPSLKISLTTLVLRDCESLESIAVLGQLESLEILICYYCHSMKELLTHVKGLKRLKQLEISECRSLKRVAAGVISSMVALEELKMVGSFDNWKGGNETTTDASLREIESLKQLRCLNIQVSDIALATQPLPLSSNLVQFTILFGG